MSKCVDNRTIGFARERKHVTKANTYKGKTLISNKITGYTCGKGILKAPICPNKRCAQTLQRVHTDLLQSV